MKNTNTLISVITASLLLSACGGGGSNKQHDTVSTSPKYGYLMDASVVGATYFSHGTRGSTRIGGSFKYDGGEVSFYVGNIYLGKIDKVPNDRFVMLQDILGIDRNDLDNERLLKAATLLQSLDKNPTTRTIEIEDGFKGVSGTKNLDSLSDSDIDKIIKDNKKVRKSKSDVKTHLLRTLGEVQDVSIPILDKISPSNGEAGVDINSYITLTFSKLVHYDTFLNKIIIKDASGNNVKFNTYLSENTMILKPQILVKNANYTIEIDGVRDYDSTQPKKVTFNFTTSSKDSVDTSSGASPVITDGSDIISGSTSTVDQGKDLIGKVLSLTKFKEIGWDKKTILDNVGKIKDRAEYDDMRKFGMSIIGNDLATSERVVYLDGKNNYLVSASRYHNALNVVDFNNGGDYKYKKFASFRINYDLHAGGLSGNGDGGSGDMPDTSSGSETTPTPTPDASSGGSARSLNIQARGFTDLSCNNLPDNNPRALIEHSLKGAKITGDGKYVYALILPRSGDVEYSQVLSTFGLFRTRVGQCGVNPYNAPSTKKIDSRGIKEMQLSSNDKMLAVYGEKDSEKMLKIYNPELTRVLRATEIENLSSFNFAFDDRYVIAAVKESSLGKAKVMKIDSEDMKTVLERTIPFTADLVYGAKNKVVVINKIKGLVATLDENLNILKEVKVGFYIKRAAISPNGTFLAIGDNTQIQVYGITGPTLNEVGFTKIKGLSALGFASDTSLNYVQLPETLLYPPNKRIIETPDVSANTVISLKLEEHKKEVKPEEPKENLLKLGSFEELKAISSQDIIAQTQLITNYADRVLTYSQKAPTEKGYNIFDIKKDGLTFTEGSSGKMSPFLRDEVAAFKMLSSNAFVVVAVNKHYPYLGGIYVQEILKGGKLEEDVNIKKTNATSIAQTRIPVSAKITKSSGRIFILSKDDVRDDYVLDVYNSNGSNIKYTHERTIVPSYITKEVNTLAPNDDGSEFYGISDDKVYKGTMGKSVKVTKPSGVFFGYNTVFVASEDGKLYTFDKDLNSKKVYDFNHGKIQNIKTSGSFASVFTENGVYVMKIQDGSLESYKKLTVENLANGFMRGDKIFAISNSPYDPNSPYTSTIYYTNLR